MPEPLEPDLASEIAREEARLVELENQVELSRRRLSVLREQRPQGPPPASAESAARALLAPAEKVSLFRSLFRGRTDVFPKLWVNNKTAKKGYAPACANEWVRGVCEKPRVKCGECPNQAFIAVSDRVVADHLQGKHVIGVYPLLEDETCWFLAVDFDKACWQEDVGAFSETCRRLDLPVAVERSRSGNGAHAWLFFASPVSACIARQMGSFIVTRTMEHRHQLSMSSYDRLFPNQDTMPRGGFGNLIALPLQHEPRQQGNTVFLDEHFEPHSDQWAYLRSIGRIQRETVEQIAADAIRRGQVVGVRFADLEDEPCSLTPWTRPPSRRPRTIAITEPLPTEVRTYLTQRVFVETAGIPPALLNEIKRLAAFQNPEFYKKQNMRLSTATTPRVIACAEESAEHIGLPRGCLSDLQELLREHKVALRLEDRRCSGDTIPYAF